nr:enoyl-CoA hydratase/isomerase family protein [Bradyrhizobium sp. AS23.2]
MTENKEAAEKKLILVEVREGVGIISLNRPKRHNAENDAMGEAFRRVNHDPSVLAVLLRGEGPSFCSGKSLAAVR